MILLILGYILALICGIGSLVCLVMVLMKMFQAGQTGLGIACIVLIFCTGIGGLIAFIYGWMKNAEWGIKNVMLAWTGCIVGQILAMLMIVGGGVMAGTALHQEMQNEMNQMEMNMGPLSVEGAPGDAASMPQFEIPSNVTFEPAGTEIPAVDATADPTATEAPAAAPGTPE